MNYSDINEDVNKMIKDLENSNINKLEVEFPNGLKIKMDKGAGIQSSSSAVMPSVQNPVVTNKVVTNINTETEEKDDYKIIKSPMVGTFYASSSPTTEPFVKVGDKVKKGQVVCIVEAMKLMNEIESEFDGEIAEICMNNEDMVEYGTPLFKIK